jgi:diguanylate cyclase (GGDEF)-like protein
MERRRHLSLAGGFPGVWLTPGPEVPRVLRVRGLSGLKALTRALTRPERVDLGFVDILSCEGALDHPMAGPREDLFWRRAVVQVTEPPRSREPVLEGGVRASVVGATFQSRAVVPTAVDPAAVAEVLKQIGTGPTGRPWDCGACGYSTCRDFAEAVARGRTSLRLCPPHLQLQAVTDPVTGLGSRALLKPRLDEELKRSKRTGDRFAVLFLDLDRLKELNDRHGHLLGDEVIREVAALIRATTREYDLGVKYGGDEFVVVLQRIDAEGALRVAEALRAGVEQLGQRLGIGAGTVTVSIGVYPVEPPDLPGMEELLGLADRAMYQAKDQGRNRIVMIRQGVGQAPGGE